MIEKILDIAKMVLAILPFVLLCFASKKVNLPKVERSKQFLMPVFTLIYVIVVVFSINKLNTWLIGLIQAIPGWIEELGYATWMPESIGSLISKLAVLVEEFIQSLNLNYWVCYLSNAVILIIYMLYKRIIITLLSWIIKTDGKLHKAVSGCFYEYFIEKNKWCIREDYVQVRSMFKTFYVASIILSAILMMVSRSFYFKELIAAMFYPAFGVLIVGELYFYLDGATRREYLSDILGEDEESYKTVNYSLLRKFLRSIFGDKVIAENTTINNALSYDGTTQDIIDELSRSEDNKIVCFATYIDALNKTGTTIDHNYLRSSIDLLNGTSILFNNPFYNDLIPYAFYPMNRAILQHKKVLVVLGRHAIEDDIREWIEKGIGAVTNIPFMWNIGVLNSEPQDLDIGIVTRSDVLDLELHNANSEFLEKVGYVVIIEPSRLISTAQIGLNMLVKKCRATEDKEIVYCMCDKNCDGLVDAMSHILMTSITEVSATRKHLGTSSYMCWEADDEYWHHRLIPNISRYLGVGTELSFAALKNQVSKTKWYGGEAFPVTDLRWISQQYYYDLTRYASLPTTPDAMDEHFATTPNFWSAEVETNNYMTVEDESYNMFEILRDFSTRATEQGFINIISSDYLLKDYMADNASIFEADAKAIPYIVADYTRSNRNAILRLILKMSIFPVSVEVLEKELSLLGISVFDLKKQLWFELYNCYSTTAQLSDLPDDYRQAVNEVYGRAIKVGDSEWTPKMLKSKESFNLQLGKMETTYYISDSEFMNVCVAELRSAGYVSEDEKGQRYYLGAELAGHIYQKYLPGQFFTFGGKYYEMQYLTSDGQVLVRRAADHINGRPEYRQRRKYVITGTRQSDKIGAVQDVGGMKIVKEFADISVSTPGYYLMGKYNDFANARYVSFEESKTGIPDRSYRNKEILRIDLPDLDGKLTDNVRYTITLLFNEIFRTIFAENQAYICAVTDESFITEEGARPLTYSIEGNGYELHSRSIYIIEDSQLDLGLTVAVERNLQRILGIIFDYLDWHRETLEASLNQPPEPVPPVVFAEEAAEPEKPEKKKGFFRRIIDKIKGLFKRKKPEGPQIVEPAPENPTTPENPTAPETPEGGTTPMGNTPDEPKNPKDDEKPEEGGENPTEPTPADDNSADGEAGDEPTDDGQSDSENQPIDEPSDNNPEGESGIDAGTPDGEPKKMTRAEKRAAKKAEKKRKKEEKKQRKAEEKRKKKEMKEKQGKRGLFGWLRRKKKDVEEPTEGETASIEAPQDENIPADEQTAPVAEGEEAPADATPVTEEAPTADEVNIEPNNDGVSKTPKQPKDSPAENGIAYNTEDDRVDYTTFATKRSPYHERYYLLYGGESELAFIDSSATLKYLGALCGHRNPLKQARNGKKVAELIETTYKPGKPDARYCDFCGTEIYGVEYETLVDGRNRCMHCSRTAVKTGEEFRKLFEDVKRNMESFFSIRINAGIKVEMVNSKTLHRRLGENFVPTPKSDGRILGVAIHDRNGFTIMVENGAPRMSTMLVCAHELTHIWQYLNWNKKELRKKYGRKLLPQIYEGMSKWVEVQYAYLVNEPAVAKREEIITSYRQDEYGQGFLRYRANYPFSLGTVITKPTPFMYPQTPLKEEFCGAFEVQMPTDGVNPGDIENTRPTDDKPISTGAIEGPIDRNTGTLNMYAYSTLTSSEKAVYNDILSAITSFSPMISGFSAPVTEPQIKKIVDYVYRDHPEIFWFQYGATIYYNEATLDVSRVELSYCMTPDEAKNRQEKIEAAIKPFLTSITDGMSDYEVVLHIYENIISLVDYDTIGLERQKKSDAVNPNVPDDLRSIYGVFVNRKAVCAGYAKAFQYLLNACGIECCYVTSATHAWNIVRLEGDYYHVDVTWGDGSNTKKEKSQIDAIMYDCFCLTTEEITRLSEHTPESILPLPACTATKCNYHRRHGLFLEAYNLDRIRTIVCESVKLNKLDISFKFGSAAAYNEAKQDLINKGKFRDAIQLAALRADVRLGTAYTYMSFDDRWTMMFRITKM